MVRQDANKNNSFQQAFVSEAFFQKYGRISAHKTAIYTYKELDTVFISPLLLCLYPKISYSNNVFYPTKADVYPRRKTHARTNPKSVVCKFSMCIEFIEKRSRFFIYKTCVDKKRTVFCPIIPCVNIFFSGKVNCSTMICVGTARACFKNVNMPKRRLFFRHTLPIFLEIHPVFLCQIGFVWRKNFSPLVIFPFFKRRLIYKFNCPQIRSTWQEYLRDIPLTELLGRRLYP